MASAGLPIIAYAMIYDAYYVAILGALVMLAGLYAWAIEPSAEPDDHGDDGHGHGDEPHPPEGEPALVGAPASDQAAIEAGDATPGEATAETPGTESS